MTNNTIPNVPRELLADLLGNDHDKRIMAERHLLAMLANAPSPAGVDGLEVVGYVSRDDIKWQGDCTLRLKPYSDYTIPLCRLSDAQAIIDGLRGENERIRLNIAEYNEAIACYQSERDQQAQRIGELAIIDGLRGEVADLRSMLATVSKAGLRGRTERDQQAQRIGELEGLLRSCLPALSDGGCAALANRIAATLSAGKEGE